MKLPRKSVIHAGVDLSRTEIPPRVLPASTGKGIPNNASDGTPRRNFPMGLRAGYLRPLNRTEGSKAGGVRYRKRRQDQSSEKSVNHSKTLTRVLLASLDESMAEISMYLLPQTRSLP